MQVILQEEFEKTFKHSLAHGVIDNYKINTFDYSLVCQEFDFLRLLSIVGDSYNIKPATFRRVLADCSESMGDKFLGLYFVGNNQIEQANAPRCFSISIDEFRERSIYSLEEEASKLCPDILRNSMNAAIYSNQGLWATVLGGFDYYGTIGMKREFVNIVRERFPELDTELDHQLFDFIRWYNMRNNLLDEWRYKVGDDLKICDDYFREIIKYLNGGNYNEGDDLIEAYRNKYVSMPFANDSLYLD
jgi:hypothetical protein